MDRSKFRVIIAIDFFLSIIYFFFTFNKSLPPVLDNYVQASLDSTLQALNLVFLSFAIFALISEIFLFFFRSWARHTYTVSVLVCAIYIEPVVMTAPEALLTEIGAMIQGGIIMLVYFSGIQSQFINKSYAAGQGGETFFQRQIRIMRQVLPGASVLKNMGVHQKYVLAAVFVSLLSMAGGFFVGKWTEAAQWRNAWRLSQYIMIVTSSYRDLVALDLVRGGNQDKMINDTELYLTHRILTPEEVQYLVNRTEGKYKIKLITKLEEYVKRYPNSLLYQEKKAEIDALISRYRRIREELGDSVKAADR